MLQGAVCRTRIPVETALTGRGRNMLAKAQHGGKKCVALTLAFGAGSWCSVDSQTASTKALTACHS